MCVCVCMYVCVFTCVFVFAMWSYLGNFEMVNMEQKRALTSIRIGPVYSNVKAIGYWHDECCLAMPYCICIGI